MLRSARLTLLSIVEDSDKEMGTLLDLQEQTAKQRKKETSEGGCR